MSEIEVKALLARVSLLEEGVAALDELYAAITLPASAANVQRLIDARENTRAVLEKVHALRGSYNGWPNRETWNVALWIGNDPITYNLACSFKGQPQPYRLFARKVGTLHTPDGVLWMSRHLDVEALNQMIEEL